jgi:hypothetical protein
MLLSELTGANLKLETGVVREEEDVLEKVTGNDACPA